MDKLVSRIRNIVSQPRQSVDEVDVNSLTDKPAVSKYKAQNGVTKTVTDDPQMIRTLIDNIPQRFYYSDSDKVVTEEIVEYSIERDITRSQTRISQLAAYNKAVCRRIYQLVLEKQPQYQIELNAVLALQRQNLEALNNCRAVRLNMNKATQGLTMSRMTVLLNYRRKNRLERVKSSLSKIKTLQLSVEKLINLLEQEEFCSAIELHRECQAVVDDFTYYKCIGRMRITLKAIKINIEEAIDFALMRTCEQFDPLRYEVLQKSFVLLGNGPSSIDQLQVHYTSIIQNKSEQVILAMLVDNKQVLTSDTISYSDICKLISQRQLVTCLQRLCFVLYEILSCYNATIDWHSSNMNTPQSNIDLEKVESNDSEETISNWSEQYQLERLLKNKGRVWLDICSKVKVLVEQSEMTCAQLDITDVMKLLNIVNRFTTIGIKFCQSDSQELQDSVRRKFQEFFRCFHIKHLERLRMFLENESWELCPVKRSFSYLDLAEFSSYRQEAKSEEDGIVEDHDESCNNVCGRQFSDNHNPFDEKSLEDSKNVSSENIMDDCDKDSPGSRLSRTFQEEDISTNHYLNGPIIANTTLEVCRIIGRYIEIMRLLQPIAVDIVHSLCQLYDYYMYSVFHIFMESFIDISDRDAPSPRKNSDRLGVVLRRIWDRLIFHENLLSAEKTYAQDRIELPRVQTHSNENILYQTIVAVESIVYLGETFLRDSLLQSLSGYLPEAKRGLLKIFSEQNLICGELLRKPIYESILRTICKSDIKLVNTISMINWNIKTVASNPSPYVGEIEMFLKQLQDELSRIYNIVPVCKDVARVLWELRVRFIDRYLLEGFSSVITCSQGGRNLMMVDWQTYVKSAESFSGFNNLFENNDVERYIQAYYIGASEFESWIRENSNKYIRQHLISIINLMTKTDKKMRQKLILSLSETSP